MKKIFLIIALASAAVSCAIDDRGDDLTASFEGRVYDSTTGEEIPTEPFGAALLLGDTSRDATQPDVYYIRPDGTFYSSVVFPGRYDITARGPYVSVETLSGVDLRHGTKFDLQAVPNVSLTVKSAAMNAAGRFKMSVDFKINSEVKYGDLAIIWGTSEYPGAQTASIDVNSGSPSIQKKYAFNEEAGTFTLTTEPLASSKTWYVRLGVRISGCDYWNYTRQYKISGGNVE